MRDCRRPPFKPNRKFDLSHCIQFRLNFIPLICCFYTICLHCGTQPKDIVEPPWYPAAPSPEPLKLRVIGLIPHPKAKLSTRKSDDTLLTRRSVGTLMDITHHVLCRPASLRSTGERAFDGSSPSGPTCLSTMRPAPNELEEFSPFQNGPLHGLQPSMLTYAAGGLGARFGWSDQIVLAIGGSSGLPSPIVPSIYGPAYGPKEKIWPWRDWRGPTVRRWMLEGFRIQVSRKHLRRINGWQILRSDLRDRTPINEYVQLSLVCGLLNLADVVVVVFHHNWLYVCSDFTSWPNMWQRCSLLLSFIHVCSRTVWLGKSCPFRTACSFLCHSPT